MSYPKLIECMKLFSHESLRQYLGDDLVGQLLTEWENNGPVTKKRLAEMIVQLNGIDLLKKPKFRQDVLLHLEEKDIEEVFDLLPAAKKVNCNSLAKKVNAIKSLPWGKSDANIKLLSILGIDISALMNKTDENECAKITHQSGKRFYELLDYQFVIKQKVLGELNKDALLKRMLIHMPTGTGKTKTTMHILVHYYTFCLKNRGSIVWLAHTTELLQQAYDTFSEVWQHLGNGQVTVYKIWGNKDISFLNSTTNGILFCGIQKMQSIKKRQPALFEEISKNTRLIIFDEAHKAAADETRQLVEAFMSLPDGYENRSLIGLSATPGRTTLSSDENRLLSSMFEDRLIGIDIGLVNRLNMSSDEYLNHRLETNIIRYFQNCRILSKIKKEQLSYSEDLSESELAQIKVKMVENGYNDFTKQALEIIGRNRSRNTAIMEKLRELSSKQIPTIVFACSVAHAKLLSFMLSLENIQNSLVLGEMNSVDRENAISVFKDRESSVNILINYEVLTTGFDSTNIRCVFITRPTQSIVLYSQMLGRGLRGPMMGGNEECLLVDIKDNLGKYDADMAFGHFDSYWS